MTIGSMTLQANLMAQATAANTQLTETTAADTAFAGAEANAASAWIDGEAVVSFNQATAFADEIGVGEQGRSVCDGHSRPRTNRQ
jgi:hypothetical protein